MSEEESTGAPAPEGDVAGSTGPVGPATAGRPRRWRQHPLLTVGAAVVLVGAGVGTSVTVGSSSPSGASSPSDAVQQLLTAANHSDVLGALAVLEPGERDAIEPGLTNLVGQLQRLDVLSGSASLSHVSGVSFGFSGVSTTTDYLNSNLAAVTLTSGTDTVHADLSKLPLGSFVLAHAGSQLHGTRTSTSSAKTGRYVIATVQEGGRWYVSLGDTYAVDAVRASGGGSGAPPASGGVQPVGAATPEGAVTSLLQSVSSFDLRGLIADLPPDEMGALQAYAPLFLPKGERAFAAEGQRVHITISNLKLSSRSIGDSTLVTIDSMDLKVTAGSSVVFSYSNGCATVTLQGKSIRRCGRDEAAAKKAVPATLQPVLTEIMPILQRLSKERPALGLMTVQENGRYYVSPIRTLLQDVDATLGAFRPSDLTTFASAFAQIEKLAIAPSTTVSSTSATAVVAG
ncbi:MAG: hypothetical protein JWM85_3346 [Acidimicrobiaceae bacterium]|nr:hypothetical protein [Acidimicrobiaceae bacterium]